MPRVTWTVCSEPSREYVIEALSPGFMAPITLLWAPSEVETGFPLTAGDDVAAGRELLAADHGGRVRRLEAGVNGRLPGLCYSNAPGRPSWEDRASVIVAMPTPR